MCPFHAHVCMKRRSTTIYSRSDGSQKKKKKKKRAKIELRKENFFFPQFPSHFFFSSTRKGRQKTHGSIFVHVPLLPPCLAAYHISQSALLIAKMLHHARPPKKKVNTSRKMKAFTTLYSGNGVSDTVIFWGGDGRSPSSKSEQLRKKGAKLGKPIQA